MGKSKKKRDKKYNGVDAAIKKPIVTRITASNRSAMNQWWYEKKSIVKPIAKTSFFVIIGFILLLEIIRVLSGN